MKQRAVRQVDGGRQRCVGCGHPRKEHREQDKCTVPKCACREYAQPIGQELATPPQARRSS